MGNGRRGSWVETKENLFLSAGLCFFGWRIGQYRESVTLNFHRIQIHNELILEFYEWVTNFIFILTKKKKNFFNYFREDKP